MKIAGVFRVFIAVTIFAPTTVSANQCDPSKPVYVFDQFGGGDDTKVFYSERDGKHEWYLTPVRFDTWRKSKLVWSIDGAVTCSDAVGICTLDLESNKKKDSNSALYHCFKENEKDMKGVTSLAIPVTDIMTGNESSHVAFGFLTAISMGCSNFLDIKVERKALLTPQEREGQFLLPPYFRRVACPT
ncbi:hypothetical protein HJB84_17545 [Rhizobium sp. NZLR1b]|uniref:hypothetical protein n=1 Tax=unclassified Rhizobium TaxID=2613769 RepID=UPI001C83F92D|nr:MULTISPECIES: hypothetical protein [unclassified Rhizobium]MBX5155588.1 hypothetical protein [Rhizobium sp. NZLR8]MBX5171644.1 hypothetical protein [Rhizobium sp. NZLR1b]MBX5185919.1 hypothetical protein [Rhizobium sp. NZLR5]MBX5191405.1 hypothetical protein [Rhizobium sp. NZLR3b]